MEHPYIKSLINWTIGAMGIITSFQGGIAFFLGVVVTLLTIYKIYLDIRINNIRIREFSQDDRDRIAKQLNTLRAKTRTDAPEESPKDIVDKLDQDI